MTENVPKRYELNPLINDWLIDECPPWQTPTTFLNDLVFHALGELHKTPEGLTRVRRLGKPSTATKGQASSLPLGTSALLNEEINVRPSELNPPRAVDPTSPDIPDKRAEVLPSSNYYAQKKQKKTDYTEGFNEFWKLYQSAPRKANGQKKPLAFEAWKQAPQEASAEEITKAIAAAIDEQQRLIRLDEFCAPLPDCFRWLRDGNYCVHLEAHKPAKVNHNHIEGPEGMSDEEREELEAHWRLEAKRIAKEQAANEQQENF